MGRVTLTVEGLVVNIKRPKYDFTLTTLTDDLIFIPERYRLQCTLISRVYCWTGARLGAFFMRGFIIGGVPGLRGGRWLPNRLRRMSPWVYNAPLTHL